MAHQLTWNPAVKKLQAGDRVVLALDGRYFAFTGSTGALLAKFYGTAGPSAKDAEEHLRVYRQLIYPAWNELLTQLALAGIVRGIGGQPKTKESGLRYSRHMSWGELGSFPLIGLPGGKFAGTFGVLMAVLTAAYCVYLLTATGWPAGRGLAAYESIVGFVIVFWLSRQLESWFAASALNDASDGAIGRATIRMLPLGLVRPFSSSDIVEPSKRLGTAGMGLLGATVLPLGIVLGGLTVVAPSWAAGGLLGGLCAIVVGLLPFGRGSGSLLAEAMYGVEHFASEFLDTILYQWLPSGWDKVTDKPWRQLKPWLVGLWGLVGLVVITRALSLGLSIITQYSSYTTQMAWQAVWFTGLLGTIAMIAYAIGVVIARFIASLRASSHSTIPWNDEMRSTAQNLLSTSTLFAGRSPDEINLLLQSSEVLQVRPGQTVMKEGELGDSFYLLLEGAIEVLRWQPSGSPLRLAELGPGAGVGEIALLENVPRTATVGAVKLSKIVRIGGTAFSEWMQVCGLDKDDVYTRIRVGQVITSSPFFKGIPTDVGAKILQAGRRRTFDNDQPLMSQGEAGNAAYLLLDGAVQIVKDGVSIASVPPGNIVGEMALLSGAPRNADVIAVGSVLALEISEQGFWQVLEGYPEFLEAATSQAARRADS